MKKHAGTIILMLVLVAGLCILLYPSVSNFINSRHQSKAIAAYSEAVGNMTEEDYDAWFAAADAYNRALYETNGAFYDPELVSGYEETLDISGTGIMGYVTIESIDVKLPIYHGTSEGVLQIGCGHLEGTSLPVGGENTHAVLSAHRGLPSAKLFTDLDELKVGDTFTITVLNRSLVYEVDLISIVLPNETDLLQIEDGCDYVTLMTCTPYGVNSHRLLVRGHLTGDQAESGEIAVTADAGQVKPVLAALMIGIPMLTIALIIMLIETGLSRKRRW